MNRAIVVASHRRSGTHLMLDLLRANGLDIHQRTLTLDRIEPSHPEHLSISEFDRRLRSKRRMVLVKTHGVPDQRAWESPEVGAYVGELVAATPAVFVHRDGRDVLVSLYHYMTSFSPAVAQKSFSEFIRARRSAPDAPNITLPGYWQYHVLAWLDFRPRASVGFGELTTAFEPTIREIADRVGIRLRKDVATVKLESQTKSADRAWRLLRRRLGLSLAPRSTAIRPLAGRSGGWRAEFGDADLALFHADAAEAMRRLGYT